MILQEKNKCVGEIEIKEYINGFISYVDELSKKTGYEDDIRVFINLMLDLITTYDELVDYVNQLKSK